VRVAVAGAAVGEPWPSASGRHAGGCAGEQEEGAGVVERVLGRARAVVGEGGRRHHRGRWGGRDSCARGTAVRGGQRRRLGARHTNAPAPRAGKAGEARAAPARGRWRRLGAGSREGASGSDVAAPGAAARKPVAAGPGQRWGGSCGAGREETVCGKL
jgi:hypothetical protein